MKNDSSGTKQETSSVKTEPENKNKTTQRFRQDNNTSCTSVIYNILVNIRNILCFFSVVVVDYSKRGLTSPFGSSNLFYVLGEVI